MALEDTHNFTPDYALAKLSPDWFEFGHVVEKDGTRTVEKKKCTDYGIFCDTPQPPPMGKIRYSRTAVPYRQDVIRNTNARDDISYTIKCYTFQDGKDFRINKIYELVKDAERLYTSRFDGYFYKINEIDGITPQVDNNGLRINYSIKLSLDPYKYFGDDKEQDLKTQTTKITVEGDMESEPVITFSANKGDVPELMGDVDFDGDVDSSDASLVTQLAGYYEKKARMEDLKGKIEKFKYYESDVKSKLTSWKKIEDYIYWWQEQQKNYISMSVGDGDNGKTEEEKEKIKELATGYYPDQVKDYIEWFNLKGNDKMEKDTQLTPKQRLAADVDNNGKVAEDWYYYETDMTNSSLGQKLENKTDHVTCPDAVKILTEYAYISTGQGNDYSVTSPRRATITAGGIKMTIGIPAHAINLGAPVTLDVGQKRLYYINEKGIKTNILQYSEGDFPILYPGDNTVAWTGEISNVKIRWQERWI